MQNTNISSHDRYGRLNASTPAVPSPPTVLLDVASILALGYVRYRARQSALEAGASRVGSAEKPLDDVPPEATFATGDRRTSETGGNA